MAALRVPFAIWAVFAPEAARRWDNGSQGERELVPLAVPITWWLLIGSYTWILTHVEPPITRADYASMALLWCAWAGGLAFAVAFTVMYLRGRRRTEGGTDQGTSSR